MKYKSRSKPKDSRSEIAALEKTLCKTHERLQELSGGNADNLHESDERFRAVFKAALTGIAVSTTDGRYLQANAAYCRMLGYSEDELRASNFPALTHPDDLPASVRFRDELLAGERETFSVEKRYLTKNGDIIWARVSVSATRSPEGEINSLVVIADDITEHKRIEDALRHSEEFLRLITNLVPHGIFAKDSAGRHIFANLALAEFAGLSIEEILGKDDFELVTDPVQAEGYRADDRAVIESGSKMVISEEPRTDLSGRTRLLQTVKIPFIVAKTGEAAVLGVCTDITERKRTEARFRRLVDSNVQGVFFWNTNGQITGTNDAFLRMVGYSREDMIAGSMSWADMTPPELAEQDRRALRELAAKGVCETFEKEFIRRDGSRVPVLVGPAMFEDNRSEGFCFVLDLSERKKLEQQLLRAQRMESIGTLAGGLAHDLNNILAPIMLSIGLLTSESETPKSRAILKLVADSAQRGANIVGQVLSFARGLETKKLEVHTKHLMSELEHIVRDTFPKHIRLQLSVPENTWALLADPTQVHQILLNLCVNARDAMPNGGDLTISAENHNPREHAMMPIQDKDRRYVCITVTDTGTGIPQTIINKIFEPFFTTKEVNKGTGLGLSTVTAIVKSHNGTINVYSEVGKGSRFKVYLPAIGKGSDGEPNQQIIMARGKGETILVVDDEISILAITCQTLEHHGYRVLNARDGAEAVAIYAEKRNEIAVVLTDMMMPIMDGTSLIRVLLRINPAIKIVTSSGLTSTLSGISISEFKYCLIKPYTAETLLNTMRAILEEA